MTRDQSNARWRARWRGLRSSGLTMKEFAQREGLCALSAYQWLRNARRCGLWSDEAKPGKEVAVTKPRAGAVFARVAVSDTRGAKRLCQCTRKRVPQRINDLSPLS